jgi:gamma-glutamyltranspeptidase/glutathione hydrolase
MEPRHRAVMVVGTSGMPATSVATEALQQGGSAVDAAMAAALVQTTLAAGCWDSFAGIMIMLYYDAETSKVYSMNAAYNTVQEEKEPLSIPHGGTSSGRTVLVPGFMAGVQAAHARFGRLPFAKLFGPAIELAESGFIIDAHMSQLFKYRKAVLTRLPEGRGIFIKGQRELYRAGDLFRQPHLAATLRCVATCGVQYMYKGTWARKFVENTAREGGKVTLNDMESYEVIWTEPLRTTYHDYEIYAPGLPGLGGIYTIEALNLLECADLSKYGHYATSAEALYWLMQITHVRYLGSFLPPESRVNKETAERLWMEMRSRGGLTYLDSLKICDRMNHSDGIVVIDKHGNIAAVCHSSNTIAWGTTGIFVDGISVPDSACFQQEEIKRVGPGHRLPEPMNPVLIAKQGKPILASSCTGYSLHEVTIQNLTGILDFGMRPKDAVDSPHFLGPISPVGFILSKWQSRYLFLVGRIVQSLMMLIVRAFPPCARYFMSIRQAVKRNNFAREILDAVRAMRQKIKIVEHDLWMGYWIGIHVDPESADVQGAVTSHRLR